MKSLINKLVKPFNSLEKDKKVTIALNMGLLKDHRYNEPKGKHNAPDKLISETIESTEIYSRAKELILNAQRKQVGYGLDKYPEPLNADTWSTVETIDHIIDESIDKLHYLVMLRLKLEQDLNSEPCEELPSYALYADGKKYMTRNSPDYDIRHIELADEVLLNKTFDIDFNGKNLYVECKDVRTLDDVGTMYLLENMYGDKFWLSKDELQKSIIEKG